MTNAAKKLQTGKYEYRGFTIRKNTWQHGPAFPVWDVFHAPKNEFACLSIHKCTITKTLKEAKNFVNELLDNNA